MLHTVCVPFSMYCVILGNDVVLAKVESAMFQAVTPCSNEYHTLYLWLKQWHNALYKGGSGKKGNLHDVGV